MNNRTVSIPQTIISSELNANSNPDQHRRVLHGSWLGLSVARISELTGVRRMTVDSIRARARDELTKARVPIPSWLKTRQTVCEDA